MATFICKIVSGFVDLNLPDGTLSFPRSTKETPNPLIHNKCPPLLFFCLGERNEQAKFYVNKMLLLCCNFVVVF